MQDVKTAPKSSKTTTKKEETKVSERAKNQTKAKVKAMFDNSAEFKIKKARQFNLLAEKFETLKAKKDELDNFIISSDGTKETIHLQNAKGAKFVVSNSQVIEKVIDVLTDQLDTFIDYSEKQIQAFQI